MGNISKVFSLAIIAIIAFSSISAFKEVWAQSTLEPSVPEFTIQLQDNWLKVIAQNQPLIQNGHNNDWIFYDFQYKWHESTNWYHKDPEPNERGYIAETDTYSTTVWQVSIDSFYQLLGPSSSHQLDYQIRAINGYLNTTPAYVPPIGFDPNNTPVIIVSTSGWSNTQTLSISDGSVTTNPGITSSPSPTSGAMPSQPTASAQLQNTGNGFLFGFNWEQITIILLSFTVVVLAVALVLSRKRNV